jgi:sigma-E factor negative regulatory protein RseA
MQDNKEQLSAYLDGELSRHEANRLYADVEAAVFTTAARYQLMAEAMRGEVSDAAMIDISASVRHVLLQEPAHQQSSVITQPSVVPVAWIRRWLRPVAGVAVAASVALVMVLTVNSVDAPQAPALAVAQSPLPLPVVTPPVLAVMPPLQHNVRPVANLNNYINEHSVFAAQDTVQGRMPYARAVSYESR